MDVTLNQVSSGAVKLLVAWRQEPSATTRRYCELTGFKERHIRTLKRELEAAGLATFPRSHRQPKADTKSPPPPSGFSGAAAPLTDDQRAVYLRLTAMRVMAEAAFDLVTRYPVEAVAEAISYVQARTHKISNPAAYVVTRIRKRAEEYGFGPAAAERPSPVPTTPQRAPETPPNTPQVLEVQQNVERTAVVVFEAKNAPMPSEPLDVVSSNPLARLPHAEVSYQLLAYSVCASCGVDLQLNPAATGTIAALYQAGYTAEDVTYFLKAIWPQDWRAAKGERLTLAILQEQIGHTRHLLEMTAHGSLGKEVERRLDLLREHLNGERTLHHPNDLLPTYHGTPGGNPYLNHPAYKAAAQAEQDAYAAEQARLQAQTCAACGRLQTVCKCESVKAIPSEVKKLWRWALDDLQARGSHEALHVLRRLEFVGYAEGCLTLECASTANLAYIESRLLPSMTETLKHLGARHTALLDAAPLQLKLIPKPEEEITD